jgi:hypothetical protein
MTRIVLFFLLQLFFTNGFSQVNSYSRQLKLITVSGNGYQRGFQQGQQLKKEIAELMVLWKKNLQSKVNMPANTFIHQFLANTDILKEVKGMADGAGQPFDDMYAFQLVDEYWVYQDKLSNDSAYNHCSGIGVPPMNGRPAYVSQNMDLETWMDGYQVILHVKKNGNTPEQYILTCAGLVALNGINEHGIGVCVNTLMDLQASTDGLPVAFMIRGLLAQKKGIAALHFLKTIKHASGQNYILGTVDSIYDFEASANKVTRMFPDASGIVYHTNNPVVNNDIKPWYKDYFTNFLVGNTQGNNSEIRFATLKRRAAETKDKDDSFIKSTLRSKDDPRHPVCVTHLPNSSGFTFGSVILTLSGKRSMQATAGPPDESEYQTFYFTK